MIVTGLFTDQPRADGRQRGRCEWLRRFPAGSSTGGAVHFFFFFFDVAVTARQDAYDAGVPGHFEKAVPTHYGKLEVCAACVQESRGERVKEAERGPDPPRPLRRRCRRRARSSTSIVGAQPHVGGHPPGEEVDLSTAGRVLSVVASKGRIVLLRAGAIEEEVRDPGRARRSVRVRVRARAFMWPHDCFCRAPARARVQALLKLQGTKYIALDTPTAPDFHLW